MAALESYQVVAETQCIFMSFLDGWLRLLALDDISTVASRKGLYL